MANEQHIINPIHSSVEDKLTDEFKQVYLEFQGPNLRADQVTYEEFSSNRSKYTFQTARVTRPFTEVGETKVHTIHVHDPDGTIDVKIYTPTPDTLARGGLQKNSRLPILLDFHGGGFVIGDLGSDDSLCRQTCQSVGCLVANVAYRTAPEFPSPLHATDSYSALKWIVDNAESLGVDPDRVAVSGLSAGGCIAAVLALLARDDPNMPKLVQQILIVPVLDARYIPISGRPEKDKVPYESYITCEFAPMLPIARLVWFYNLWLGSGADRAERANDWRASPMVAKSLADLAPASLHVAGVDPLRSEAELYHRKLTEAGTSSNIKIYEGVGHPYGHWDGKLKEGREFLEDIATVLKSAFAV